MKISYALCIVLAGILTGCAGTPGRDQPAGQETAGTTQSANPDQKTAPNREPMSLDEVVSSLVKAVEAKVQPGAEIAIVNIEASQPKVSDFLYEELYDQFSISGNLTVLARGQILETLDQEHQYQMSGAVSDESAVGIGHYLGAKAVITGTFEQFEEFSLLRIWVIDVETSTRLVMYSARISSKDPILANITR